jgi:hypothetical protein
MGRYTSHSSGLSELESRLDEEFEFLVGEDDETGDDSLEAEFENFAAESDDEFEENDEFEFEGFDDGRSGSFGERFYELSQREWESEHEIDTAIDQVLSEMEREYFFSTLAKGLRSGLKKGGMSLLKKGMAYAKKRIPAFQALQGITQLARGNLGGSLRALAKAGLASAIPGGAAVLPALSALGFEASQDQDAEREAWDNFANIAREAYETLADTLTPNADQPLEASRLANSAFQSAMARYSGAGARAYGPRRGRYGSGTGSGTGRRIRVTASRGDTVIVRIT